MSALVALLVAGAGAVQAAQVVFSTDFESASQPGGTNTEIHHGGAVAGGFAASPFTQGAGIGTFRLDASVAGDLFISEVAGTNPASNLVQAVAADAFFAFTVTAPAATGFTELRFAMRGFGSALTGYITVRSSVDGYAADLATVSGTMNNKYPATVDLSAFGGFANLDAVTFRFYVYDLFEGHNNRRFGIDDIAVSAGGAPPGGFQIEYSAQSNQFILAWPHQEGRTCTVWSTTNLAGAFEPLAENLRGTSFTNQPDGAASRFFRVSSHPSSIDLSILPEGAERVDIYLLLGQSNMKGRGAIPAEQEETPLIVNMNMADHQWYPARHPLHKAGVPDLIDGSDNAGVGPGLDFAQTLRAQDGRARIALVPCALGGSWINLWQPGRDLYTNAVFRAQKALADAPPGKGRIAGVLWLQGESDAIEARHAAYEGKLATLVQSLRTDLGDPDLPFIACTIGTFINTNNYPYVAEINGVLLGLPAREPRTACVDARDLTGHIGDSMHYDTASQVAIGQRYAAEHLLLAPPSP